MRNVILGTDCMKISVNVYIVFKHVFFLYSDDMLNFGMIIEVKQNIFLLDQIF